MRPGGAKTRCRSIESLPNPLYHTSRHKKNEGERVAYLTRLPSFFTINRTTHRAMLLCTPTYTLPYYVIHKVA